MSDCTFDSADSSDDGLWESDLARLLCEEPFRIKGPEGKMFYAYSTFLAQSSKVFANAINGQMKESDERMITLVANDDDIDDDTVMYFLQHAYDEHDGNYVVPTRHVINYTGTKERGPCNSTPATDFKLSSEIEDHSPDGGHTNNGGDTGPLRLSDWTLSAMQRSFRVPEYTRNTLPWSDTNKILDEKTQAAVRHSMCRLNDLAEGIRDRHIVDLLDNPWVSSADSFTPISDDTRAAFKFSFRTQATKSLELWFNVVAKGSNKVLSGDLKNSVQIYMFGSDTTGLYEDMLAHARVYVFSRRYECRDLTINSLKNLRGLLSIFDPYQDMAHLLELITYTYKHTPSHEVGCDRLRAMLVEYVVCYYKKLMANEDFMALLQDNDEFKTDVLVWALKMAHI